MSETSTYTWPLVLGAILREGDLSREAAAWAMGEIMSGSATPAQTAGFVVALRARGESAPAVAGLVDTMLEHAPRVEQPGPCVDIVGTGGDQAQTVNISTMAAIVVAGAGVPVAKHGNRAASSQCGSADVLEALGVALALDGAAVVRCIREVGIGFFFAPQFHSGMRFTGPTRKELGIPTVFNFLGPLSNPARPTSMAVGCADERMAGILADTMRMRGVSALVFRGDDGLDELTTVTTSRLWQVAADGSPVRSEVLDPAQFGIAAATPEDLRGGDPAYNAQVVRDLLAGAPGPVRDAVLLNAAAAIVAYDGVSPDASVLGAFEAALARAGRSIDDGSAAGVLDRWVELSSSL
ncbi:anthranilate phosphoribosyltransferase [Epidermidibacterium keratini]|uniref:Anthranilate phosphoribosyltransferase n=1 Tax=Epidermidibacterium keratini TaxID=1891644 RepID=A0A7L4YK17_9ACTN|nr:anthranilate phosphoribosyltransferase [Epidermidibacterium keratini]QHB99193.1 anthranilate phosphoribosyltransferase [Epidermidibacterium keratini]